jgi:hypothetical protein
MACPAANDAPKTTEQAAATVSVRLMVISTPRGSRDVPAACAAQL